MTATDDHQGELCESDYQFQTWVRCSCGWRSRSYQTSEQAWIAFQAHRWVQMETFLSE